MKRACSVLLVILLAVFSTLSQSDKPLTNQDVIEMSRGGLSALVIISKIKTSKTEFKTQISDLKLLTEEKVPESVVAAMVEKQAERDLPKKPVDYSAKDAEHGTISELKGKNKVFVAVQDSVARQIVLDAIRKSSFLTVVDNRSDADFGVNYAMERVNAGSNMILGTPNNVIVVGELMVYTYLPVPEGESNGRIRILWSKRKQQDWSGGLTFNRHPAQNAIKDFFDDFKKSNR